jgi:sugar phosphate isomerase/epimerase
MAIKLGYCALRWKNPDLERALTELKKAGWDGWECRLPLDWLGPARRVKKICDNAGMPMIVYTASGSPENYEWDHVERNKRRMDFAAEMGVDCFMYMSGRKPEGRAVTKVDLKRAAEAADSWADYAAQYKLELSYHIHTNLLVDSVEDWTFYMAHLKKAKLCIDVSHAELWGYDPLQSLRDFKDQLNYVHLQDYGFTTRDENGRYLPWWVDVGEAESQDFSAIPGVLKEIGYVRWVTACPGDHIAGADDPINESRRSKKMYEYLKGIGY